MPRGNPHTAFAYIHRLRTRLSAEGRVVGDEPLGYLDCVESGAFLNLVADKPERYSVGIGEILAYTADVYIVAVLVEQRHGISSVGGIVFELQPLTVADSLTELGYADGTLGLSPNALAMAAQGGDTDAHCRAVGIGMHNLLSLVVHLHLLLGIAVVGEGVNLWYDIEGKLVGKLLNSRFFACKNLTVLLNKLGHGGGSCPTGGLVAGDMNASDMADVLKCLKGYNHHNSGAVGIGDYTTWTLEGISGIAFGDDEGDVLIHAEGAGIVYHDGSIACDGLGIITADAGTGTGECDIYATEIVVVLKETDFYLLASECVLGSCAALTAEQQQLVYGKVSLVQYAKELLSYGTACSYNGYLHFLLFVMCIIILTQN